MSSKWQTFKLRELGRIVTGKTPKTADAKNFGGRIPFITPSDMDGRKTIRSTVRYLTATGASSVKGSLIPSGSIMVSCIGSDMGKTVVAGYDCVTNQQINSIIVDKRFNSDFVYYNLSMRKSELQLLASSGSTMPILNKSLFSCIDILIPPLPTQTEIADILSTLDDRIALLRETNTTLEAIAQALFKSWFVDFDPVRAKQEGREPEGMDADTAALFPDSFEESELGLVPKGWKVGVLGDIAVSIRKQIPTSELNTELSYIGLEHMPRQSLSICNWDNAQGLESAKAAFSKGDILFGKLRPYFHKVIIAPFEGVCSTDILVCRSKQSTYYGIITMHLFSVKLVEYANRLSNGAKMPRVNWKDIAAYTICIPSSTIAKKYSNVVIPLFERMMANVHTTKTLETLRDTLLPRLISGQLRIPEAETIIEEATV